jgi:hypothetical protein
LAKKPVGWNSPPESISNRPFAGLKINRLAGCVSAAKNLVWRKPGLEENQVWKTIRACRIGDPRD